MMTLNEQAYEHKKKMISEGELSYHEIYSETKLSRELGISRTPFRDAIHRLVQEGYIDIIPSKGFRLHQLTRQDVTETFQVRSALETYCTMEITRTFASKKAKRLFSELHFIMDEMKEILEVSQSIQDFCTYDFQFHISIVHYLENQQFSAIFDTFMYRMQRLAQMSLSHPGRMKDTYDEHLAILNAMEQGDTAHIYDITLRHMDVPRGINLEDL